MSLGAAMQMQKFQGLRVRLDMVGYSRYYIVIDTVLNLRNFMSFVSKQVFFIPGDI